MIDDVDTAMPQQGEMIKSHLQTTALCISVANPWRCREIAGARAQ